MYNWSFKDYPKKNGLKVFGTFICGGGSTMGFKLAGFEHLGGVEIDPKVAEVYQLNHNPKYLYNEDIRTFLARDEYPEELYNLDVLEGSPPCSSFSLAGNREKDWGKKKVFAEGQAEQRLDDLFFDWIKLVDKLQPKIAIAENVKGMIIGSGRAYSKKIIEELNKIGYDVQLFLLNASTMGVPQKRERVFFICRRKDLNLPELQLNFNENPIKFKEVREKGKGEEVKGVAGELLAYAKKGETNLEKACIRLRGKGSFFNTVLFSDENVPNTILTSGYLPIKFEDKLFSTENELKLISSFPQDYKFKNKPPVWFMGMSVPPVMMCKIARELAKLLGGD